FLCGRQRKVGAAPHRGDANKPLTIQGKANPAGTQKQAPRTQINQKKPNAAGKQTNKRRRQ
ncbi:hypothetical protein P0D75_32535, partial [Paraburkholderia sediminicola]|uniref:hypothetical protein n=1 Tax=Paraburkholderia sediminicola TaxID=458836 RepID=UPI0038B7B18F